MPDVAVLPNETPKPTESREPVLTQGAILRFYLPLAISWLFMSVESPIGVSILSRLDDAKVNTAAMLMLMAISLWIESPVIDLLATATTLAKGRIQYLSLRKFALWLIAWVTLAHAAISATPLYGVVTDGLLRLPAGVTQALHLPLIIMIPWSGCIGWRRFLQGIMIRNGRTLIIGIGTCVRVFTMGGTGLALYLISAWPGLVIVATALVCSVAAECVFIHLATWPIVRRMFCASRQLESSDEAFTMGSLARFHFPLTASTMVTLTAMPLIGAALARTPDHVVAMAGWQVAVTLLGLFRTVTFALTEPVIALYKDEQSLRQLHRFALNVGFATGGGALLCAATGLDALFFGRVLQAKPDIVAMAHLGLLVGCATPFVNALMMVFRGALTAHHETPSRLLAICVGVSVLLGMLWLGVGLGWPGVVVAAVSMTVAMLCEGAVLGLAWRGVRAKAGRARSVGF